MTNSTTTQLYTSCKESADRFSHGQVRWLEFSENLINELSVKLRFPMTCSEVYWFLAEQRGLIAKELNHGASDNENRTSDYGYDRGERWTAFEYFYADDRDQSWKYQKSGVFAAVNKLLETITQTQDKPYYESDDFNVDFQDEKAKIIIKSPHKSQQVDGANHSDYLSTIYYSPDKIAIEYAEYNKYNIVGDFNLSDHYFQAMLAWKEEDGIASFLENAGRLSHLLAHILPVKLGNAAITEWMIYAVAHSKNIFLGPFNQGLKLSWDFQALVTPNREAYAKWYSNMAFPNCHIYESGKINTFSFAGSAAEENLKTKRNDERSIDVKLSKKSRKESVETAANSAKQTYLPAFITKRRSPRLAQKAEEAENIKFRLRNYMKS